jgi:hypothetical protein
VKDLLMKENFKATIDLSSSFKTAEVEHIPNIPSPPPSKTKTKTIKKKGAPIIHLANKRHLNPWANRRALLTQRNLSHPLTPNLN